MALSNVCVKDVDLAVAVVDQDLRPHADLERTVLCRGDDEIGVAVAVEVGRRDS